MTTRTRTRCDRIIDLIDHCLADYESSPRLVFGDVDTARPARNASVPVRELRLVASR